MLGLAQMVSAKTACTSMSIPRPEPTARLRTFQSWYGCESDPSSTGQDADDSYGGSFTSGAASFYDPTLLMAEGLGSDRPFIFVGLNYRLGALGFPYGSEIAENNAANLGLRDVQKGLEWVQDHIWAFGGNPDQVTVFGESAGAILISLLYLQPDLKLFKSAIMESGAQSTAPLGPTGSTWQGPYNALVDYAGCNTTASTNSTTGNSTSAANFTSSFDCLKSIPASQLLLAQERTQELPQYSLA